ncbi:pyridoxamine 5'-phosphate oxidase family protein [Streptomonospora wellingtoniae]|uniref:Pyridoxamine 5'-phosphate oxidase family protein n=1 Tax=Streptomonospora wellingtoniae TaxID=3075544 RepID=A0ABU2KS13_9ACTN|nr:pyridoxamine 5'-phosphate oxidase family protein [Streptomonospora sp. DSM 45055]MDT0302065.1 pyridoxamine 5'-phosphate oxidase family protein [Streptomonospora sp. DSM 45055]
MDEFPAHAPSAARTALPVAWADFSAAEPAFAAEVGSVFGAAKHHVLATLRADGSPRVSGTEVDLGEQELLMGSMLGARKAQDLQRDGRLALHAAPGPMDAGDAKIAGVAVEVTDLEEARALLTDPGSEPGAFHLFRVLVGEAVLTSVTGDRLRIRHWRPGRGLADDYRD